MLPPGQLESIAPASAALVAAARRHGLDVPIPSCPTWCMADLVWHTGIAVYTGVNVIRATAAHTEPDREIGWPPDDGLVDWLEAGSSDLVDALSKHDPDDTMGAPMIEKGFPGPSLHRHFAREVGVHRWDAEHACGTPSPIDDELAADWMDGVLVTWLPLAAGRGTQAVLGWDGESVHFHRSDGLGDWSVRFAGEGVVSTTREHGDADVMVSGPGSALLLLVMNRIDPMHPDLEVKGDRGLLERWAADVRYGRPAAGAHWVGSPRPQMSR